MDENKLNSNPSEENEDNSKRKTRLILIFIILFIILFCAAIFGLKLYNDKLTTPPESTSTSQNSEPVSEEKLIDNPIDFNELQRGNNEIYAWIKIDDTKIDYPICQSRGNDEFYLRHKAEDKSWSASGAIYTESANNLAFTDPITMIYGHNGYSDTMFTTLHYFEKEDFFNSHEYFYIYKPHQRLKYQVVSAFKYDNRHILNSFDFNDEKTLVDFQQMIQNPESTLKNVRAELDTEITKDSNIVILSTCITNQKSSRYLVCGVLVANEKTN